MSNSNSEIVAQLLRDLAGNERDALRDYYAAGGDEQQICARYQIAPGTFQSLKSALRTRFRELRDNPARKPANSAGSALKTTLRRIA